MNKKYKVNAGREFIFRAHDNFAGESYQGAAYPGDVVIWLQNGGVDVVITDGKTQQRIQTMNYPHTISKAVETGILTQVE
jgi:hypothetical protein